MQILRMVLVLIGIAISPLAFAAECRTYKPPDVSTEIDKTWLPINGIVVVTDEHITWKGESEPSLWREARDEAIGEDAPYYSDRHEPGIFVIREPGAGAYIGVTGPDMMRMYLYTYACD